MNLVFFGDQWDAMWRRRQQLAWRLAKTGLFREIIYVEQPLTAVSYGKYLIGKSDKDATARWRRIVAQGSLSFRPLDNLVVLTPITLLPLNGSRLAWAAEDYCRCQVQRYLLRFVKRRDSVVWVSIPYIPLKLVEALKPRLLWYDCTEDFSARASNSGLAEKFRDHDEYLTKRADVVSTVSVALYDKKAHIHPNVLLSPNAVDVDAFVGPATMPLPSDLAPIDPPRLVFVGGDSDSQDWDLVRNLVDRHPEWSLVFIGRLEVTRSIAPDVFQHPSVHFLGEKPYLELPGYLQHCDVCLQLYKPDCANSTRNSQKVFLYLASGKPVVSTRTADVESYRHLVGIADDAREFVEMVALALTGDSVEQRAKRIEAAKGNSWEHRVGQIEQVLRRPTGCVAEN